MNKKCFENNLKKNLVRAFKLVSIDAGHLAANESMRPVPSYSIPNRFACFDRPIVSNSTKVR